MNRNIASLVLKFYIFVTLAVAGIYFSLFFMKNKTDVNLFLMNSDFLLSNIMDEEEKLVNSNGQQIFFLETHLEGKRKLKNARQACSVEAAARTNPDMNVYLVLATNQSQVSLEWSPLVSALLKYPNVHIRYANLINIAKGTPLEQFMENNTMKDSKYPVEHASDVLRVLTLYKFGGVYLDLDVLSLFPIRLINTKNFVCLEGYNHFSNAIFRLDLDKGRKYSESYLKTIAEKFDPNEWANNGPNMISPVFMAYCNDSKLNRDQQGKCGDLDAIPNEKCFTLMYGEFYKFYEDKFAEEIFKVVTRVRGYFIHVWNKMLEFNNRVYVLNHTSQAAYMQLGRVYCPEVVATKTNF